MNETTSGSPTHDLAQGGVLLGIFVSKFTSESDHYSGEYHDRLETACVSYSSKTKQWSDCLVSFCMYVFWMCIVLSV